MGRPWTLVLLAGCGRLGFDGASGGGGVDAAPADSPPSRYADAVRADQPVAYWRFSETTKFAPDEVGGKTALLEGGITHVAGATNDGDTAIRFDGMTGRAVVGDFYAFAGNAPYTIELWGLRDAIDDHSRWMIDRTSSATPDEGWQIYTGIDFTLHSRTIADVEQGYAGTTQLVPGVWSYFVATYDGTTAAFYRDGVYTGGMLATGALADGAGLLVFGDLAKEQFFKYDGALDDIAIYERVLSEPQIAAHYAASGR